jgi:hypothetical protein
MQTDLVAIVLNYLGYGVAIAAIGAAVIVVIAALARAVFLPGDVRRQACCGGCGHPVGATPGAACAECGGAFGKVGIITPGMALRLRGGLGVAVLAWSIVCTLVAAPFFEVAKKMQGQDAVGQAKIVSSLFQATFQPHRWDMSTFGSYTSQYQRTAINESQALEFRIECNAERIADSVTGVVYGRKITLDVKRNGARAAARLEIDPVDRTWKLHNTSGQVIRTGESIDDALIREWFLCAEIDVEGKLVAVTLRDALWLANVAMDDPDALESRVSVFGERSREFGELQGWGGVPRGSTLLTPQQVAALLERNGIGGIDWRSVFGVSSLAVPVGIWFAGVIWMVRRRRRILAA